MVCMVETRGVCVKGGGGGGTEELHRDIERINYEKEREKHAG